MAVREDATIGESQLPRLAWRAIMLQAFSLWVVTRLVFMLFTYFAVTFNSQGASGLSSRHFPPSALLDSWNHWDTGWYTHIAQLGYDHPSATAFLPLFPILVRVVASIIGWDHVVVAALLVSNLGTLAAFIALGLLSAHEYGQQTASYAVRAVAAYPLAFFLFAGYSDGLFLALVTFTLLFARRGFWIEAASCTFLACLTRPTAVVLILPIVWEYGYQHRELLGDLRQALTPRILGEVAWLILSMPLAFGIWEAYLWVKFHDPMVFFKAQKKYWDHETLAPWNTVQLAIHTLQHSPSWSFVQARVLVDLLPVVVVAVLSLFVARRIPVSFTLYMVGVLAIFATAAVPLDYDPFNAEGRYVLMSVPIFLILAKWMKEYAWVDLAMVSGGFMLQGLLTAFWLRGGWIV